MVVWVINSLKSCALSNWWAEGLTHYWIPQLPNSFSSNIFYYFPQEKYEVGKILGNEGLVPTVRTLALVLFLQFFCHKRQKQVAFVTKGSKQVALPHRAQIKSTMTACSAQQIGELSSSSTSRTLAISYADFVVFSHPVFLFTHGFVEGDNIMNQC